MSTRLRNEMPLEIGGRRIPPGELVIVIDLKSPKDWTFVLTSQPYALTYNSENTKELYGAYNYRPDHDVAHAPMRVDALPYSVNQLMWWFTDVASGGGTMRVAWERVMASVPFNILQ